MIKIQEKKQSVETNWPDVEISQDFIITILKNIEENMLIMNEKNGKSFSTKTVPIFSNEYYRMKKSLNFKNKRFSQEEMK